MMLDYQTILDIAAKDPATALACAGEAPLTNSQRREVVAECRRVEATLLREAEELQADLDWWLKYISRMPVME